MKFLMNCWYVAAWGNEIKDKPEYRKIVDHHIVLYRGEEGRIVALDDTCPHRFAPLHRGKIVNGTIECLYHGLRFDEKGACALNPFNPDVRLGAAHVRAYPVVERDRLIWIWMGDADRATLDTIPDLSFLNDFEQYTMSSEQVMWQDLNYQLILDNLLDLSHGQFLHPTTLGNSAQAGGKVKTYQVENRLYSDRWNPDGEAPTLFTLPGVVEEGTRVDYWNDLRWDPPGAYYLEVGITPTGEPREKGEFLASVHLLTPQDETHTAYRYCILRTFSRGDDKATEAIEFLARKAFTEEDQPMIRAIQERMDGRPFWSMKPVMLHGDKAAVLGRRIMEKMLEEESATEVA